MSISSGPGKATLLAGLCALAVTLGACSSKSGQQSNATTAATPTSPATAIEPTGSARTVPTITRADNGTTLRLGLGDRFLLQLGEDFDWNVSIADQSVVSRVIGITVVRGAQGIYEATAAGTTALTAIGDPPCRKAQPPCEIPSIRFTLNISVSAALSP